MHDLTGSQTRQLIDCEQAFIAWRDSAKEYRLRFAGSMTWKRVKGVRYLYRKKEGSWKSLGRESDATREIYDHFRSGRTALRTRLRSLDQHIAEMAPVNRAMRIGRVPTIVARILRRLDKFGALGHGLRVVGTNALYGYERLGGVHFASDVMATRDIDFLYDARRHLHFLSKEFAADGLIGALRAVDPSFSPVGLDAYRAANQTGFLVDLITPATRNPATRTFRARIGEEEDDLRAAEIEGLSWLESSPAVETIAIDESGFPLAIIMPDPRAFACHKLWIAARLDREPLKQRRDLAQAHAVTEMLVRCLPHLRFDGPDLNALPAAVRNRGAELADALGRRVADAAPSDWSV